MLTKGLQPGYWQFLEKLDFRLGLKDSELAQILEAANPLKHLFLYEMEFGLLSSVALLDAGAGKHKKRLETLSLFDCPGVEGSMVQRFMCEMPELKVLRAPVLSVQDVPLDPRPWACRKIEAFTLAFVLVSVRKMSISIAGETAGETAGNMAETLTAEDTDSPTLSAAPSLLDQQLEPATGSLIFLDRLATLTQLRALIFEDMKTTEEYERIEYMKMRMDYVLDRLKTLRRLAELNMDCETGQDLDLEEAQWMMDHWPKLAIIHLWSPSPHFQSKPNLCQLFEKHGMEQRSFLESP